MGKYGPEYRGHTYDKSYSRAYTNVEMPTITTADACANISADTNGDA